MALAASVAVQDGGFELLHADTLRFFPELVTELGGDPAALLRRLGLDPSIFRRAAAPSYRSMIQLLELAAGELQVPDLGMRLAARQGGGKVFGIMGVVMKNSTTFGEALAYVVDHIYAHSLAVRMRCERDPAQRRTFVGYEILLDRVPNRRQAIEQALLLAHLNAAEISGGQARVREVLFRHQPLSSLRVYRDYFGCEVSFDQPEDGVVYGDHDLACPIADPDEQLYEMATAFIDAQFTRLTPPMHAQVRGLILQHLGEEACTNDRVAAGLGLHPRTLHRRLKAEGKSFEAIKDEVRREVALRHLQQTDLPLTRIAEKLGYAETSVLSRSCYRWFGVSPRRLRAQAARAGAA
jgi:AraC-like DNA-binding protein